MLTMNHSEWEESLDHPERNQEIVHNRMEQRREWYSGVAYTSDICISVSNCCITPTSPGRGIMARIKMIVVIGPIREIWKWDNTCSTKE